MVGVDTYSLSRWQTYDEAVARIRRWLRELPEDVSRRLAYGNAEALFDIAGRRSKVDGMRTTKYNNEYFKQD
jgi:hypothetical protein